MKTNKPFLVFVGGEGSGKSTQSRDLETWLTTQGLSVLKSREPGGTPPGEKLRQLAMKPLECPLGDEAQVVDFHLACLADQVAESGDKYQTVAERVMRLSKQSILTPDLQLTLFVASRMIHVKKLILPFLNDETGHDVMFCDRFWPCSYAYQVFTGLPLLHDTEMADFFHGLFDWHLEVLLHEGIFPEIIFLDIDPEIGLQRVGMRNDTRTAFDDQHLSFHWSLRHGYLDLLRNARIGHEMPRYNVRMQRIDATPPKEEVFAELCSTISTILQDEYEIHTNVA